MEEKYYSEFISEEFYEKIAALRVAKGIKCFEYFYFIFVNANECKSKTVKEMDLETTKIDEDLLENITNIMVLSYGTWKNTYDNKTYTNSTFAFIGIYDMKGNESPIKIGSIALNSINICSDGYFQTRRIGSCNITISHNQFDEYLKQVSSPIHETIWSLLYVYDKVDLGQGIRLEEFHLRNLSFKYNLTMDIGFKTSVCYNADILSFHQLLSAIKGFEQKLNNTLSDTKFDPEITIKIKSSEIKFDTSS